MREDLLALRPDELRAWLQHQWEVLAPHRNGTRRSVDLTPLVACLRAQGCARCAEPLVEHAAYRAGQVLCETCTLAAGGATVWCGWTAEAAGALRSLEGDPGIPDDDDPDEDEDEED
jgi:hypothetical protein